MSLSLIDLVLTLMRNH